MSITNESRPSADQAYRLTARVVMEAFEHGALILRLADQHLIELNPIASAILAKSDGRHSLAQVAEALAKACEISESEARQDITDLYAQFLTQGIIEPVPPVDKDGSPDGSSSNTESRFFRNPDAKQN